MTTVIFGKARVDYLGTTYAPAKRGDEWGYVEWGPICRTILSHISGWRAFKPIIPQVQAVGVGNLHKDMRIDITPYRSITILHPEDPRLQIDFCKIGNPTDTCDL